MAHRQQPCRLMDHDDLRLLFLQSLSHEPFIDTFYYGRSFNVNIPYGQKAQREMNALARLNTLDFHHRNHSDGRMWTIVTVEAARVSIFDR
jgi:hypothetical protein